MEMLDYAAEEFLGDGWRRFNRKENYPALAEIQEALTRNQSGLWRYTNYSRQGDKIIVRVQVNGYAGQRGYFCTRIADAEPARSHLEVRRLVNGES